MCLTAMVCMGQTSKGKSSTPNRDARVQYVNKNIGISRDKQKELTPLLYAYLKEKKEAGAEYDALKDKLKKSIDMGSITNDQADKLLSLKWAAEKKETAVKIKYTEKFKTVLSSKQTYKCFDLLNDKKSKIQGKKSKDDSDDD